MSSPCQFLRAPRRGSTVGSLEESFMSQVRYTVTLDDPNSHLFHVKMEVKGAPGPSTDFVLPAWTPGSYKLRDFAKNVQDFSAGRQDWRKVDKSRWRVAAGGNVTVEYDVWAFELSVQTSHLDADHAFINGASVFMYADGLKDVPLTVDLRIPKGWRIATGLDRRGRLLSAPNYDLLVDCPIEAGTFTLRTFKVRGVPHHLAIHGEGNYDEDRMVGDVRKIVRRIWISVSTILRTSTRTGWSATSARSSRPRSRSCATSRTTTTRSCSTT